MYLTWVFQHNYLQLKMVSERFYRTVFTRDYNIVFNSPKTDVCSVCERLANEIKFGKQTGQDVTAVKQ